MDWHPFAEKFPLLQGEEWEAFKKDIASTNGPNEPVAYRYADGKKQYLDGRNRWNACRELGLKCQTRELQLTDAQALAFIKSKNLHRRHDLPKEIRAEIVLELRAEGQTTRQIAETLGVGKSTVERDLQEADSVVPLGTTDIKNTEEVDTFDEKPAKVTGKDGKEYQASKPPKVLCDRCQRTGIVKGCMMCAEARADKKKEPKPPKEKPEHVDAFGNVLPERCRHSYQDGWIQETIDFLAVASATFWGKRMADGLDKRKRHYPFLNAKDFIDGCAMAGNTIDDLLNHLKDFRPAGVCPSCQGKGCASCKLAGMVPRKLYAELKENAK